MDEIGKYVKNLGLHNHTSSKQYNMQKMDEVGKQCLVNFNARNSRLNSRVITPIPSNSFYKTPILSLFPFFFFIRPILIPYSQTSITQANIKGKQNQFIRNYRKKFCSNIGLNSTPFPGESEHMNLHSKSFFFF